MTPDGTGGPGDGGTVARTGAAVEMLSPPQPSDFPDRWYELNSPSHFWFVWRLRAFRALLADLGVDTARPARVLDIGCGTGVSRTMLEGCTSWTIDGAELNMAALAHAAAGRGRLLCYDILEERPSLAGSYDFVLLFDVIEHIEDAGRFMASALRHLIPGGRLFVNVPAAPALYSSYDRAAGHLRRYDRAMLARELNGCPGLLAEARYWGMSLLPVLAIRKLLLRGDLPQDRIILRGFAPSWSLVNAAFRCAGVVETRLLHRPPRGASLLAAVERV